MGGGGRVRGVGDGAGGVCVKSYAMRDATASTHKYALKIHRHLYTNIVCV